MIGARLALGSLLIVDLILGCASEPTSDAGTPDGTIDVVADAPADVKMTDATLDDGVEASNLPDAADATDAGVGDAVVQDADGAMQDAGNDSGCKYLGGQCNTLPSTNPVAIGCVQSAPMPQGGQVLDGYYELTKADYVADALDGGGCFPNEKRHGTVEICGSTFLWLECDTVNSCFQGNLTISTMNTSMTFKPFCSGNSNFTLDYTVSGNDLVIYFQYPMGALILMTYTRM